MSAQHGTTEGDSMPTGRVTHDDRRTPPDVDPPESLRRLACLSRSGEAVSGERPAASEPSNPVALAREVCERDRVTECVVLSTCNRIEVYASTRTAGDVGTALSAAREALDDPPEARAYTGLSVADHLARVACGLESPLLGEDEVLGQVADAFDAAERAGLAGGVLARVAETAVRVGRRCRTETAIDEGVTGYGGAVRQVLAERLDEPPDRLLVVGAGELAATVVDAVTARWAARVDVANRSPASLATDDGRYWPLDELGDAVAGADAVVSATAAPEPVLTGDELADLAGPVVDLARPPDVARRPRRTDRVTTLQSVAERVEADRRERLAAVDAVEDRIGAALDRLVARERESRAEDTLRALHRKAARTRDRQLDRALDRIEDGDADPEAVLEDFASALTGRLLADPTDALREAAREADDETIAAAHRLFDLGEVTGDD